MQYTDFSQPLNPSPPGMPTYSFPGQTPVSNADIARAKKNQQLDAKRRQGTQARQAIQTDAPPQLQAPATPPPTMQSPNFTPAQYKPPAKGLEYLAMGLGLLFPGAPIARAAAGFAQGLNQGAEQSYQRREGQAEQQYQVEQNKAAADFQTKEQAYKAAQDNAQRAFQNAQIQWQNRADLRARGINPITNQPFQYPTLTQLTKGKNDYSTVMQAYNAMQALARRNGEQGAEQTYAQQMQDYQQTAMQQARDSLEWQRLMFTQQEEDRRAASREASENAREEFRQSREDARA